MMFEAFYLFSPDNTSTYIISCLSSVLFFSTILGIIFIRKFQCFQTNYKILLNGILNILALFIILTDPICL